MKTNAREFYTKRAFPDILSCLNISTRSWFGAKNKSQMPPSKPSSFSFVRLKPLNDNFFYTFYAQIFYILRINSQRHAPRWCVISNGKNETTLLPCTYVQCHAMYVVFDFVEALHPYATHTWLRSDSTMCVSLQLQYWSYKCSVGFYDAVEDKTSHFRGCANGHPSRDYLRCFQNPEIWFSQKAS